MVLSYTEYGQCVYILTQTCVHSINAHNFLLTMFKTDIFHVMVHNNVLYALQLSKQSIDALHVLDEHHAKIEPYLYVYRCIVHV